MDTSTLAERVLARATINLPGFPAGEVAWVDARSEYVQECFEADYLVLVASADE